VRLGKSGVSAAILRMPVWAEEVHGSSSDCSYGWEAIDQNCQRPGNCRSRVTSKLATPYFIFRIISYCLNYPEGKKIYLGILYLFLLEYTFLIIENNKLVVT
jgi:hypothetical protein